MPFKEPLPNQCPPESASDSEITEAWRLVSANPPTQDDFKSHAALGKTMPPGVDPCRWSSCSLIATGPAAKALLPKIRARKTHIAKLSIPTGSGLYVKQKSHIDFWMFSEFDPTLSVVDVEPVK